MKQKSLETTAQSISAAYCMARDEASGISNQKERRVFVVAFLTGVLWSLDEYKNPTMTENLRRFIHEIEESEAEP